MKPSPLHPVAGLKLSHYSDLQRMVDRVGETETPISPEYQSFLQIIVDRTTWLTPRIIQASCPIEGCNCQKISTFANGPDVIMWGCERCGENGVITDWKLVRRSGPNTNSSPAIVPSGGLLFYSLLWVVLSMKVGYEVYQEFRLTQLILAIGFLVVGGLLWARHRWALAANSLLGAYMIVIGALKYHHSGRATLLIGGLFILASCWTFRSELKEAQRAAGT